jgi:hypothetical protein
MTLIATKADRNVKKDTILRTSVSGKLLNSCSLTCYRFQRMSHCSVLTIDYAHHTVWVFE